MAETKKKTVNQNPIPSTSKKIESQKTLKRCEEVNNGNSKSAATSKTKKIISSKSAAITKKPQKKNER